METIGRRAKSVFVACCLLFLGGTCRTAGIPAEENAGGAPPPSGTGGGAAAHAAEDAFSSFRDAYPGRFDEVSPRNGDWTIVAVDRLRSPRAGERFYWAEGKLLPETALPRRDRYAPHPFYRYPARLAPVPDYTPEMKADIRKRIAEREKNPLARHPGIFSALWRIESRRDAERLTKPVRFLAKAVRVHIDLAPVLKAVEAELLARARSDAALRAFIGSIQSVQGYSWRRIAGTASLSFHSFGAALDVIPANPGRKETYWRWAMERDGEWFTRPLAARLLPPESFIEVFEKHGFVWGGKWFYFDTIHFEYRPEILIAGGFRVARSIAPRAPNLGQSAPVRRRAQATPP